MAGKVDVWKVLKVFGIGATIVGGIATAVCDIPDFKQAIDDAKNRPKLTGSTDEESE